MMDDIYLKFIDAVLIADGEINTGNLIDTFGISRQKASKMFSLYREHCPLNMSYTAAGAGSSYKKSKVFKGRFLKGDAEEFLNCIDVVFTR